MFNIHLASVYGFCRGVQVACSLAQKMIDENPDKNLYSIGKLVHNDKVVSSFASQGLKVINRPEDGPPGIALIRAHGITRELRAEFEEKGYTLIDGTCRIVFANQMRCSEEKKPVLYFGIRNHAETVATVSYLNVPYHVIENEEDLDQIDSSLSYDCVIQTTFSSEKLARFKKILSERGVDVKYTNNICMASTRRRQAVTDLSRQCDTVFIIGEPQSANTTALYNLALSCGVKAFMIDGPESITDEMLDAHDIGICAGASVSPKQVGEVISFLESRGGTLLPSSGGNSAS